MSAIRFMRENGFDYNEYVIQGIPFISPTEMTDNRSLRKALRTELSKIRSSETGVKELKEIESVIAEEVMSKDTRIPTNDKRQRCSAQINSS